MATANYLPDSHAAQDALSIVQVICDLKKVQGDLAWHESNRATTEPPSYDGTVFRKQEDLSSYLDHLVEEVEVAGNFILVIFRSQHANVHIGLLARRNEVWHIYYSRGDWKWDGSVDLTSSEVTALMWFCAMVETR